jgi:hypothetical protein
MPTFVSWLWLAVILVPLIVLERYIHRHLQGLWLLLFRDPDIATILYSVAMLPGVALHELSHWIVATLLGVRTGRFSLLPERLPDGTLRLGFVETEKTDLLREALIGAAPLMAGCGVVLAISFWPLQLGPVGEALSVGDGAGAAQNLLASLTARDAWLWLYVLFTVSNSMLPSASDRRAWLPMLAAAVVLAGILVYFGFGALVVNAVSGPVESSVRALATAFTVTVALNIGCVPILWLVERGLSKLTGLRVEY